MEKKVKTLEEIATDIVLSKVTNDTFYGWEYRKGKNIEDVKKAIRKGRNPKLSYLKVEFEIKSIEMYLHDVFKKERKKKSQSVES